MRIKQAPAIAHRNRFAHTCSTRCSLTLSEQHATNITRNDNMPARVASHGPISVCVAHSRQSVSGESITWATLSRHAPSATVRTFVRSLIRTHARTHDDSKQAGTQARQACRHRKHERTKLHIHGSIYTQHQAKTQITHNILARQSPSIPKYITSKYTCSSLVFMLCFLWSRCCWRLFVFVQQQALPSTWLYSKRSSRTYIYTYPYSMCLHIRDCVLNDCLHRKKRAKANGHAPRAWRLNKPLGAAVGELVAAVVCVTRTVSASITVWSIDFTDERCSAAVAVCVISCSYRVPCYVSVCISVVCNGRICVRANGGLVGVVG